MAQSMAHSSVSIAVRSGLWIVVSIGMLVHVGVRIHRDSLAGKPVTNYVAASLALWIVVLCFWFFSAIWDWKRRKDARKVV